MKNKKLLIVISVIGFIVIFYVFGLPHIFKVPTVFSSKTCNDYYGSGRFMDDGKYHPNTELKGIIFGCNHTEDNFDDSDDNSFGWWGWQ